MRRPRGIVIAIASGLAAAIIPAVPGAARADTAYTFIIAPNTPSPVSGAGPVQDQAVFVVGSGGMGNLPVGTIQVTLTDQQANPNSVGQLLSALSFTVTNGSTSGATLASSSAQEVTVNGDGSFLVGSTVATGWAFSQNGTGVTLDVLGSGGVGPKHLIIGPPGGPTYSNAGGSITGNGPHNPFLNQSATFTVTGVGITANTQIAGTTFSFGTTEGMSLNSVRMQSVPEPGPLALAGAAAAGLTLLNLARRRRRS
jgi:hypothetical protein